MDREQVELLLFRTVLDHSFDAIVIADERTEIRYWSQSAKRLFGYSEDEALGVPFPSLLVPERHQGRVRNRFDRIRESTTSFGIPEVIELETLQKSGQERWVALTLTAVMIESRAWTVAIIRDIDQRKSEEHDLRIAATTDPLSGLANRAEFQRNLENNLSLPLSLVILDLDNFKSINDLLGHLAGDAAIQFLAKQLGHRFPNAICIARLGGDEFGMLLPSDHLETVTRELEKFRLAIEESQFEDRALKLTLSIGATRRRDGDTPRNLLARADAELYRSKHGGRNRVSVD